MTNHLHGSEFSLGSLIFI